MINHAHNLNSVLPFTRSLVLKLQLEGYTIKVMPGVLLLIYGTQLWKT